MDENSDLAEDEMWGVRSLTFYLTYKRPDICKLNWGQLLRFSSKYVAMLEEILADKRSSRQWQAALWRAELCEVLMAGKEGRVPANLHYKDILISPEVKQYEINNWGNGEGDELIWITSWGHIIEE